MIPKLECGSTIYISGAMRGQYCYQFKNFFYWQVVFERSGYVVINPAEIDAVKMIDGWVFTESQYEDVMAADLLLIESKADAVFVLKEHKTSEGALREIARAEKCGIPVFYEEMQK